MSSKSIKLYDKIYVVKEKDDEECAAKKEELATILLFLLSGIPTSFSLQDSLWCELPWFEISQPEGDTLASWFLLMQSAGCLCILCLLFVESHVTNMSKIGMLYFASLCTVVSSILLTFAWHYSLGGVSVFLLLASFVGQITGWVRWIFVFPWFVTNYNPRMISALITGNSFMISFLVCLEIIQEPGGVRTFSPTLYYLVTSMIYGANFGVCIYTFNSGIGRLTSKDAVQALEPWRNSIWTQTFTPVFCETKLLTFGRIWIIQCTWAVAPIALPYAAENTKISTGNDGENFLQWAIAVGYLMEFLGSASTYIARKKFFIPESMALTTIGAGVIVMAAFNVGDWSSWWMRVVLMITVGASKFFFGWVDALIPRELSRRFPEKKELVVRSNSLWSLYASIVIRLPLWYVSNYIL